MGPKRGTGFSVAEVLAFGLDVKHERVLESEDENDEDETKDEIRRKLKKTTRKERGEKIKHKEKEKSKTKEKGKDKERNKTKDKERNKTKDKGKEKHEKRDRDNMSIHNTLDRSSSDEGEIISKYKLREIRREQRAWRRIEKQLLKKEAGIAEPEVRGYGKLAGLSDELLKDTTISNDEEVAMSKDGDIEMIPPDPLNPLLLAYVRNGPPVRHRRFPEPLWWHDRFDEVKDVEPPSVDDPTAPTHFDTRKHAWKARAGGVYIPPDPTSENEEM